ncbi:MAG: InlB B-repeat-containing protein [Ruminococcus sp.]|nr:InlB B-repeat-containing protein [Ruminococcus sp.]
MKTMIYWVEALEGENDPNVQYSTYIGIRYKQYDVVNARYNMVTEAEDFLNIEGFTRFKADPAFVNGIALNNPNQNQTINMYYQRVQKELLYDPNYPTTDPDLTFDGIRYQDDNSAAKVDDTQNKETLYFEQSLSGYDKDYQQYAPDNYTFAGWFTDKACSDQFDFDTETMPSDNLKIYAKWEPVKFRIKIDPNGAEIDHIDHSVADYRYIIFGNNIPAEFEDTPIPPFGQSGKPYKDYSTYFNGDYQEKISEYTLDPPEYIAISDEFADTLQDNEVYYYMNNQFIEDIDSTGLPKELRNALYLTEQDLSNYYYNFYIPVIRAYKAANPAEYETVQEVGFGVWKQNYVSKEKYTDLSKVTTNKFALEGWFEVNEDGTLAEMPYDFETAITRPYSLRAAWKLEGGYTINYIPKFITDDNIEINGDMDVWQDPIINSNRNYADKAETTILRQPDDITADGVSTPDYIFRGWRIVGNSGTVDEPEYYPLEPGVYYQPGEKFNIQSKYADSDNYIHMQAVYEKKESSFRRPDVAKLILDANKGELVGGDSLNWIQWYGSDSIGTISPKLKNDEPTTLYDQLRFHSFQSNAAVHLFKYATGEFYTNSSGEHGANYFSHGEGYMLLGFDDMPDEGDYIATYAADGIISVPRTEDKTIYAVWEPTVYANFTNNTNSDITFSLTANDTNTLYIVNQATSLYDRVKLDDLSNITIRAGETLPLRLAIPYGKDKNISVSGVNNLGTGKLLVTSSYLPGVDTPNKTPLRTDYGQAFDYTEKLVEDTHGIDIVFEEVKCDYILRLEDPQRGTGTHEFDFTRDDLNNPFTLSETRSSIGYIFKGWANNIGSEANFLVNDQGYPINLTNFFNDPQYVSTEPSTLAKVRTLYAVWEIHNQAGIVHIYKDGPLPGNPDKEYEFNINLSANYRYNNSNTDHPVTDNYQPKIKLRTGEHIVIESDINYGDITTTGYIHLKIQKYDANGNPIDDQIIIGKSAVSTGNFSIPNYSVTVTEEEYSNFDTTIDILASTIGYNINEVEADKKLYWTDPNTGGTAVYTNTRKKADVNIAKDLIDPDNTEIGREFRFKAELVDTNDANMDYSYTSGAETEFTLHEGDESATLIVSEFSLHDDEDLTLKDLPVNATLRITEIDSFDHDVTVTSAKNSADLNSKPRVFEFVIPADGDNIKFTNTLRKVNLKLYSVDENHVVFENASYQLSFDNSIVYPNIDDGLFYTKEPMYLGSFTVTQKWCDDAYEKIDVPMNFSIIGTDSADNDGTAVEADISNYYAEYDPGTQTWSIYIVNCEKIVAPTGVADTPIGAIALIAVFTLMFCTAFVYINCRRKEVE